MAESTWKADNVFIHKYVPNNLKWYERDGLDTWYLQNKWNEFLEDPDLHLKQRQIVNFDLIKNGVSERTIKQYNQIDHDEIKKYPAKYQDQISVETKMSSKQLKFSLNSFRRLDLPNLLLNIWDYSDFEHRNCSICKQYKNWGIPAAKESGVIFIMTLMKLYLI